MSLIQSGTALLDNNELILGTLVLIFNIIAPLIITTILLTIGAIQYFDIRSPFTYLLGRLFYEIQHWNMVDVFVIGVLVSLTKIASMANIIYGVSFWCFIAFSICIWVAVNAIDSQELWKIIKRAQT